jgi:hypothetical protein
VTISATIRDIAIIIIAIQTIIIGILLSILIWQVWRLFQLLQTEVQPLLEDTQETVRTVRGTAVFVSDSVIEPVVRTSGNIARWRRIFLSLAAELRPPRRTLP